jgi:hypothetical protein
MGLPTGHPFLKSIKCWQAKEFCYTTLLAEFAYNAVIFGAHDVLRVLSSRHNTLYSTAFGPTGEQNLLQTIVAFACAQPCCLEEIAVGIRTLMVNQRLDQEELHTNQRGSHGNSLHLAAAKGDRELVDALLDIGCDPTIRCDHRALLNENNSTTASETGSHYDEISRLWLPEDWARVRGHVRVSRLLVRRRKRLQQQRQIVRNTSDTTGGDYDTVTANDTVTAEYDSNSSYSGSYDSEYDSDEASETTGMNTFEEGPTFDDGPTLFGDESSFDESVEDSLLYNTDRPIYKKSGQLQQFRQP